MFNDILSVVYALLIYTNNNVVTKSTHSLGLCANVNEAIFFLTIELFEVLIFLSFNSQSIYLSF